MALVSDALCTVWDVLYDLSMRLFYELVSNYCSFSEQNLKMTDEERCVLAKVSIIWYWSALLRGILASVF